MKLQLISSVSALLFCFSTFPVTLVTSQDTDSSSSADVGLEYHLQGPKDVWSLLSEDTSDSSDSKEESLELDDGSSTQGSVDPLNEVTLRGAIPATLASTSFFAGKAGKGKGKGKGKGGKGGKGKKGKKSKKGKNKGKAGKHPGGGNPSRCIDFGREAARRIAFNFCVPSMLGQQLGRWSSDCRDVAIDVCQGSVATEVINQCGFLPRTRVLLRLQDQCDSEVRRMIRNSW